MEEYPSPISWSPNEANQYEDAVLQSAYSKHSDQMVEEVFLQLGCVDFKGTQQYENISEASNCIENNDKQHDNDKQLPLLVVQDVKTCTTEEDSDPRPELFLPSEQTPFVWTYRMDYPTDPPEYIPGFSLKLPGNYTFEFIFPDLFRRMYLPPPYIPKNFLYWTYRNPTVLQHVLKRIAFTSLGMVVESLEKETAVRTLFWKAGFAVLFGSYDASLLFRFAAYRLIRNDWESAFYLYIAAVIRIARKLETSKNKLKYKDKDFGELNHRLNVVHVVRKHPRKKRLIIKVKPVSYSTMLKTYSLVKRTFNIKNDAIRKIFKEKTKSNKLLTFENYREERRAEDIANDIAYRLAFSDCGEKSIDKDFEYQYLLRDSDEANMKKHMLNMLIDECNCGISNEPAPFLKEVIKEDEDVCSKILHFNFPSEPSLQNQEHSEYCVGSLLDPNLSYLTEEVINYVLKSSIRQRIKNMPAFNIPLKCVDIETTKQVFQNLLTASVKSWFTHTSRAHPLLKLPLKYLDVDLNFLIKLITRKEVDRDKKRSIIQKFSVQNKEDNVIIE